MSSAIIENLSSFLELLKKESELIEIDAPVDPYLEIAEIHRRVIAGSGPALLFTNVVNSDFPVVTNLFGTSRRMELAFGRRPQQFVRDLVQAAETLMPPTLDKLWSMRSLFLDGLRVGTRTVSSGPVLEVHKNPPKLTVSNVLPVASTVPTITLVPSGRSCWPASSTTKSTVSPVWPAARLGGSAILPLKLVVVTAVNRTTASSAQWSRPRRLRP